MKSDKISFDGEPILPISDDEMKTAVQQLAALHAQVVARLGSTDPEYPDVIIAHNGGIDDDEMCHALLKEMQELADRHGLSFRLSYEDLHDHDYYKSYIYDATVSTFGGSGEWVQSTC